MDSQFESSRAALKELGVAINITSRDEHVGEIERYIRTVKERVHTTYNSMPFNTIPPRMVMEMVKHAIFWINAFPHATGISATQSPRTLVTGLMVDAKRHARFEFGEYVQMHELHDKLMTTRTTGALALRPTGNI